MINIIPQNINQLLDTLNAGFIKLVKDKNDKQYFALNPKYVKFSLKEYDNPKELENCILRLR